MKNLRITIFALAMCAIFLSGANLFSLRQAETWKAKYEAARDYEPQVGDIYVSYYDNRNNEYALTNGFPVEGITVIKITAVTNGEAFWSSKDFGIHPMTNAPQSYPGGWGPVENFHKYREYRTLVKPNPK